MHTKSDVSAIVVNYNGEQHLSRCLESLTEAVERDQCPLREIIVVDNASTDGSLGLVRREFPFCHLVELDSNIGFGSANNIGFRHAVGDHVLFINSDARIAAASIVHLRGALEQHPRCALAAPQLRYPDGCLQFSWIPNTGVVGEALQKMRNPFERFRWTHTAVPRLLGFLHGRGWHSAACVLVRANAFREIGGFDERIFMYFEDVDLCRRLELANWEQIFVENAEAIHVKGGSGDDNPTNLHYRRAQLYYYRKHRPNWENRVLRHRLRRKLAKIDVDDQLRRLLDADH